MSDHVFVKLYLNKNRIHILFSAHAPRVAGINVRHVHSQKIGKTNNELTICGVFFFINLYLLSLNYSDELVQVRVQTRNHVMQILCCWGFFYNQLQCTSLKNNSRDRIGA